MEQQQKLFVGNKVAFMKNRHIIALISFYEPCLIFRICYLYNCSFVLPCNSSLILTKLRSIIGKKLVCTAVLFVTRWFPRTQNRLSLFNHICHVLSSWLCFAYFSCNYQLCWLKWVRIEILSLVEKKKKNTIDLSTTGMFSARFLLLLLVVVVISPASCS